jgi:hypothetical protein
VFACYGFWRLCRRPSADLRERRFERFLFCWFFVGLTIFAISPHQRGDLLWPIMPAGALIAGRELARLTGNWRPRLAAIALAAVIVIGLSGFCIYYFHLVPRRQSIQRNIALKALASDLEHIAGREFPLTHVDSPMTLQTYLNTLRPRVTPARAAALLRAPEPAFVAVTNVARLESERTPDDPPWFTLLPADAQANTSRVWIVSNRPALETDDFGLCFGPVYVRAHGFRLLEANDRAFRFHASGPVGELMVSNEDDRSRRIRLEVNREGRRTVHERLLAPGETWQTPAAASE